MIERASLPWPIAGPFRITQTARDHTSRKPPSKNALDLGAREGTPVLAVMDGVVLAAGWSDAGGWHVRLGHTQHGAQTYYAHMRLLAVARGTGPMQVTAGELIGWVGSTGNSTGPHLHFELWLDGRDVDPAPWMKAP